MYRKNDFIIVGIIFLLLFSCMLDVKALKNSRARNSTKMLAMCYQAKMLFLEPDKFVLPRDESFSYLSPLHAAVNGTERFGYMCETDTQIYIVFRGSETYSDILRDFIFWKTPFQYVPDGGNVHKGFLSIYSGTSVKQRQSLRDSMFQILKTRDPKKQLIITGFSLGGALATLAACDIAENSQFSAPTVYTFASPRVGDQQFVNLFNRKVKESVRVINIFDYIPSSPGRLFGYHHVKGQVILSVNRGRIDYNHSLDLAYFAGLITNTPEYLEDLLTNKEHLRLCPPLPGSARSIAR